MPRASKEAHTEKQKRMASHIEESEKKRGMSPKRAAQVGWATVNKETGSPKKSASSKTKKRASSSRSSRKTH